ncbi:hypothetical protein PFAG_05975, partial [Plasmodium falciparum Santa Lucia]
MTATSSGGSTQDAKHVLDEFGQEVYNEKVKSEAQTYKGELEGNLKEAKGIGERVAFHKTCDIINDKRDELLRARGDPCRSANGNGETVRYSKERVDEYDEKKIRDSNKSKGGNNEGECAPYRRLSLCNKNFQNINNDDSTNAKNDLLLD